VAIEIHCPYCRTARSVADGEIGHAVACGKCGADLSFDEQIIKAKAAVEKRIDADVAKRFPPPMAVRVSNDIKHFYTKVAGVSYLNDDGTNRQIIARKCRRGDVLLLAPEENNPHDKNAVRVLRKNGEQLGYLTARCATGVATNISHGYKYGVFVTNLTGGTSRKPTRGVNLIVFEAGPDVSDKQIETYVSRVGLDDEDNGFQAESESGDDVSVGNHTMKYFGLALGALLLLFWIIC